MRPTWRRSEKIKNGCGNYNSIRELIFIYFCGVVLWDGRIFEGKYSPPVRAECSDEEGSENLFVVVHPLCVSGSGSNEIRLSLLLVVGAMPGPGRGPSGNSGLSDERSAMELPFIPLRPSPPIFHHLHCHPLPTPPPSDTLPPASILILFKIVPASITPWNGMKY
jgi:hypothetical protein